MDIIGMQEAADADAVPEGDGKDSAWSIRRMSAGLWQSAALYNVESWQYAAVGDQGSYILVEGHV